MRPPYVTLLEVSAVKLTLTANTMRFVKAARTGVSADVVVAPTFTH
jgi:hypothetical protein